MANRGILAALVILALAGCAGQVSREELAGEYYNIGNAYFALERYEPSAEYYARAVDLDPKLFSASYNLARAYIMEGRLAEAEDLIDEMLKADPENTRLLETKGYVLYLSRRLEDALEVYQRAGTLDAFNPDILHNMAVILEASGRIDEAYRLASEAMEVDPEDGETLLLAGRLALAQESHSKAVEHLEHYVEKNRSNSEAQRLLADAYRKGGFFSKSLAQYDQVLQSNPRDPLALFGKSVSLLVGAQDEAAGLETLRAALDAGFQDAELAQSELLVEENIAREPSLRILEEREVIVLEGENGDDSEDRP